MGDPIEMKAIGRVFRRCRSVEQPLYVGSVKANIGHLEGASALASIVKSIFILERGIIPPNALFERINPDIDMAFYHTEVPAKSIVWPTPGLRRVSVNSFGFGGSNTHAVLDDALHYLQDRGLVGYHCTMPVPGDTTDNPLVNGDGAVNVKRITQSVNGDVKDRQIPESTANNLVNEPSDIRPQAESIIKPPKVLVWTAADEKAVKRTVDVYQTYYHDKVAGNPTNLDRLAYTLSEHRSRMLWRTFSVVADGPENQAGQSLSPSKPIRSSTEAGLAFVFTGQGAQYADMGWDLVRYPVFAETLRRIDEIYKSLGCTWSIFGKWYGIGNKRLGGYRLILLFSIEELRRSEGIDKPEYAQPLSTAVQIALVELLKSFGITPKAVAGHSSGEIAAA